MEINFSRIENYLNNDLNAPEKELFEKELQTDKQLAERYNFYKNLKKQQVTDLKPIEFERKILPDINDINFTEKKEKSGGRTGAITGLIIIFIAISSYLLITNNSIKERIASIQSQNDSLSADYQVLIDQYAILSNGKELAVNEIIEPNNETIYELNQQIEDKEKEIALLKSGNSINQNVTLNKEVEELKKELAKVKQEYFENSGQLANEKITHDVINSLRFINLGSNLKINWKSTNKYKVQIYTTDNSLINSSQELVVNEWIIKKPEDGFYILKFFPVKGDRVELLLELKKNSKIWLPVQ